MVFTVKNRGIFKKKQNNKLLGKELQGFFFSIIYRILFKYFEFMNVFFFYCQKLNGFIFIMAIQTQSFHSWLGSSNSLWFAKCEGAVSLPSVTHQPFRSTQHRCHDTYGSQSLGCSVGNRC